MTAGRAVVFWTFVGALIWAAFIGCIWVALYA